jgi:hypothetical protein
MSMLPPFVTSVGLFVDATEGKVRDTLANVRLEASAAVVAEQWPRVDPVADLEPEALARRFIDTMRNSQDGAARRRAVAALGRAEEAMKNCHLAVELNPAAPEAYQERGSARVTLGDVAGKGAPAALLSAMLGGIFLAQATSTDDAATTVARINQSLIRRAIEARLYDPEMPPVDLMIRTSGEQRLSNFLPWQAAYAELVFTETLWPDFDRHELARCIRTFQARDRRFGKAVDRVIPIRS